MHRQPFYTVHYLYNTYITSIYYSLMAIENDIYWSTYELTADTPYPGLTGVAWDIYFRDLAVHITSIYYSRMPIANGIHWSTYEQQTPHVPP